MAVGLPGHVFYPRREDQVSAGMLMEMPDDFTVAVAQGTENACAAALEYHAHLCNGDPDSEHGREHALARGWAAPQQAFALQGKKRTEGNRMEGTTRYCNLVVRVYRAAEQVAILACSLSQRGQRGCLVQAIHAAPSVRGPLRLPERMWERAKRCIAEQALEEGRSEVRFGLEMACCQSQQGAHFWITRMGWDGTEEARKAAGAWERKEKWLVGQYVCWYDLKL